MNIHQIVKYIEEEEPPRKPVYTYLGNPEEEDIVLSKSLEMCVGDYITTGVMDLLKEKDTHSEANKVQVYVCMYFRSEMYIPVESNIMSTLPIEYLSFFMENTGKYTFPSFEYKCNQGESEDDDPDANLLKTACIEKILRVRSMEQKHLANFEDVGYKGFISHNKNVFVFFDSAKFEKHFKPSKQERYHTNEAGYDTAWVIVDELMKKKSVFGIPVDPLIIRVFMKNPIVWNIQYCGMNIVFPRNMYALISNDIEENEEMDYSTEMYPQTGKTLFHMSMPLPYSYSNIFSERYLFTYEPLPGDKSHRVPKRYACFIHNPKSILDKTYKPHHKCIKKYPENTVENIEMEIEDIDVAEQYREIPSIYFVDKVKHHNKTEMWGFLQPTFFQEIRTPF